jgi:hypothetical protein
MDANNGQLCNNSRWHNVVLVCNYITPICKWQLGDYYGITTKQVHLLMNLMLV